MNGSPPPAPAPSVLRSLASAVVLDGRGDVELTRESRGAPVEWGGVYGQLVRLTGAWRLTVGDPPTAETLPETWSGGGIDGESFVSRHRARLGPLVHRIVPLADGPGAVRSIEIDAPTEGTGTVSSLLEPYLLPVLVEGIRPVRYECVAGPGGVTIRHRGFELEVRFDHPATALYLDGVPWRGERRHGPVRTLRTDHAFGAGPRGKRIVFEVRGGLEREVRGPSARGGDVLVDPVATGDQLARQEEAWRAATPELEFPQSPTLTEGYRLARAALRRLYTQPGDGLTGLVAGFPWYAAIWCRDVAWMLPAVVWLGDRAWAERTVSSVLRFQSTTDLPIVGGEAGELPMQIAPGPIFFYGTSDTTLYFPELARRLLRHGTDPATLAAWAPALERALRWGERRTDPATGLLRHGGEAAELETATQSLARVRYGIDAVDTTIWDSTDRRDHAIDVQVLWVRALRAAAELGLDAGGGRAETAARLETTIRERYWWEAEGYLYDSWRASAPVEKVRPNALLAVSAGLLAPDRARRALERAARDDLSTPWGVRTLSRADPTFSPEAYHDGQVWPIATAWAADASLRAGSPERGVAYLETIAAAMKAEGGQANECYRGDRAEPFNSCFLLGLSVGPFLSALFESLWGLSVDARRGSLDVRPSFPSGWSGVSVRGLAVGPGTVDLTANGGTLEVAWHGRTTLHLSTPGYTGELPPEARVTVPLGPSAREG